MGRTLSLAALGAALTLAAGCSRDPCRPGTLSLHVLLTNTAPQADTVTISDALSTPPFTVTATRAADPPNLPYDELWVEVAWPGGYPAGVVVHLQVRALAGSVLLGENEAVVRLAPGCSAGNVYVYGDATPDGGAGD
jgi:hypothetical protein